MQIMFDVHNVSTQPVEVPVMFEGETIQATIVETVVELVTRDASHGSLVLRFRGAEARNQACRAFIVGGSTVWNVEMPPEVIVTPPETVTEDAAPLEA